MSDEIDDEIDDVDDEELTTNTEVLTDYVENEQGLFDVKSHVILPKMYLAYALSVIKERSLPDIRDGLKPVARRILFSMNEMSLTHSKPTRKSARVVGDVMGKYHPHGDGSIYGTAVRMAQPFTTRYPTIVGQGNFGSVEDPPAAMRYTEMKMSAIADEVLADIDKETVDFIPNFDGTMSEPKVLPTKIPLFLVNGSIGIAVGMATSAAPHNLTEVLNALLAYIDNEDITVAELMQYIKGPDFPSAAYMFDSNIEQIYETGRGSVVLRAKAEIVENNKKQSIIITELPYQVDKSTLIERIATLYKEKKLEGIDGITDIRDESDKTGTRIVIELKRGLQAKTVLNTLYRRTELQTKYSISMRALINNIPQRVGLKKIFSYFLTHRKEVVTRRTEYELKVAEKKAHILKGYLIAFENIDSLIEDIKTSVSTEETYEKLRQYTLTDEQIKSILELKIQRLAKFERSTIETNYNEVTELIGNLKLLLDSEELVVQKIKEEIIDIRTRFGDDRRTIIIKTTGDDEASTIDAIEEIQEEEVVITVTNNGLVKRTPMSEYRIQNVRGRGLVGVDVKSDDYVRNIFQLSTRDFTLVFTNAGNCYRMNIYDIPSLGRTAAGSSILNILNLSEEEKVVRVVPVSDLVNKFFIMVTKNGKVKKLKGEKLRKPRSKGTKAIGLSDDDSLIDVKLMENDDDEILLVTRNGMTIRFESKTVRASGRSGAGVRAIRLQENDSIVSANVVRQEDNEKCYLMVVTEKGYAKRTILRKFRIQKRGGRGLICMSVSVTIGKIISANIVNDDKEQFIVMTMKGLLIRLRSAQIRRLGRNTQGSRIQKLQSNDSIAAIAYIGIVDDNVQIETNGKVIIDETADDDSSEEINDEEDVVEGDGDDNEVTDDEEESNTDDDD